MSAPSFQDALAAELPALRAFARALSRNAAQADDLVQEALLKAWANRDRFEPGTNLRAWLFTILRNTFYSLHRKRKREVEDVDGEHAARLTSKPAQDHHMAMQDFAAALEELVDDQREALILVGAAGLSYDEAADVIGVATGTVKSRVSRARARLAELLGVEDGGELLADATMEAAVASAGPPTRAA